MLLSFRVANHGSLREPQELNLAPAYGDDRPAVPVVALYGANASGKSTLMQAYGFFVSVVKDSQARWLPDAPVPRTPFLLDHESRQEPSSYGVDVLLDGVRYVYGFSVTDREIAEEWLYSYPKGRRRVLYERTGMTMSYGATLTGERLAVERTTRPNSLYLSAAAQAAHPQLKVVWSALTGSLRVNDGTRQAVVASGSGGLAAVLYEHLSRQGLSVLAEVLTAADLGVHSIRRRPRDGTAAGQHGQPSDVFEATKAEVLEFIHRVGDEEFVLPATAESAGTKTWLSLVTTALVALLGGGEVWVDELDISLHPLLAAKLLGLFQDPELNPCGAQLIFTTHDASLLGSMLGEQVLRRDQVWFVEKAPATGASELYPLSDFKPRKGENFERRYLAGSYGAVPLLPATAFEELVKNYWQHYEGDHGQEVPARGVRTAPRTGPAVRTHDPRGVREQGDRASVSPGAARPSA
ncbi:ATP/GTP-binding protein [Streptomyces sp. NPDC091272]|uniref:AAA family ATPase n=1 Tax=Streptomyces sp. NPDC091272 TaxID=3365981 RepID=UPI00381DB9CE